MRMSLYILKFTSVNLTLKSDKCLKIHLEMEWVDL